jgi:hypothetical protein
MLIHCDNSISTANHKFVAEHTSLAANGDSLHTTQFQQRIMNSLHNTHFRQRMLIRATQFRQRITSLLQETHFRQRITNSLQNTLSAMNANLL